MLLYTIKINILHCNYQIFINQFPIIREFKGYPAKVQIPLNQYLKTGRNELNITISSLDGQAIQISSSCKVTVLESEWVLASVETPDFTQKPTTLSRMEMLTFFYWHSPASNFTYFDAPIFDKMPLTQQKIRDFYQYLGQIIARRDVDRLMVLSQLRDKEVAQAYDISLQERIEDVQPFLQKVLQHPHLKLRAVDLNKQLVRYYCEDRVVCLENEWGQQPIILEDDTIEIALTFYICYNQNHEFIIIR